MFASYFVTADSTNAADQIHSHFVHLDRDLSEPVTSLRLFDEATGDLLHELDTVGGDASSEWHLGRGVVRRTCVNGSRRSLSKSIDSAAFSRPAGGLY